jgi:hypothetical protein
MGLLCAFLSSMRPDPGIFRLKVLNSIKNRQVPPFLSAFEAAHLLINGQSAEVGLFTSSWRRNMR